MAENTAIIKAELDNGATIHIEATILGGEEPVASNILAFRDVASVIEGIAESITTTLKKVKPQNANVEFGLEIGVESGQLTALLVKSAGTASLKITLGWGEIPNNTSP